MKKIIYVICVLLFPACACLVAQDQAAPPLPTPPAATPPVLPTRKPFEVPQPRSPQALPPQAGGGGGARYGMASGGYGGYGGGGTSGSAAFTDRLQRIITRASGPVPGPSRLIIRSSAMDPKAQAALGEDLAVMAHILNKALDESSANRPPTAMGIDVFAGQGPSGVRMLYLEDYGVVYTLNAGIPLLAAKPGPEKKKEEAPADTAWEEAKRELSGQGTRPVPPGAPVEEFSAEKVERLTDALIDALRNARNIRGLKPDDSITVCVLGTGAIPEKNGRETAAGSLPKPPYVTTAYPESSPQKGTVMTIRVKKSEIDAFGKGSLKFDDFRKQVRVERYEDAGAGAGAIGGVGGMMGGVIGSGGGF